MEFHLHARYSYFSQIELEKSHSTHIASRRVGDASTRLTRRLIAIMHCCSAVLRSRLTPYFLVAFPLSPVLNLSPQLKFITFTSSFSLNIIMFNYQATLSAGSLVCIVFIHNRKFSTMTSYPSSAGWDMFILRCRTHDMCRITLNTI